MAGNTVFLSHNREDTAKVRDIVARLQKEGIDFWVDVQNLAPGDRFMPKITKALEDCKAFVCFVGPKGISPYQEFEIEIIMSGRALREDLPVIPILLAGANESQVPEGLRIYVHLDFRQPAKESESFDDLVDRIRGGHQDEPRRLAAEGRSPYRRLDFFEVDDWPFFFGRERLIEQGVKAVEDLVADGTVRCYPIVGSSGSGKSSLARAGLVHALSERHPDWQRVILEPGDLPLENLVQGILKLTRTQLDALELRNQAAEYGKDHAMLSRAVIGALGSDIRQGRLLILVDQFEEIFSLCKDVKIREAFIGNLLTAARDSKGKTVVLLCVRADFYEDCAQTELADILSRQQMLVGPMNRDELSEAIRGPARAAGCEVEPELVARLADDCLEQPAPLPLMQIVLEKLWEKRGPDHRLTAAEYDRMSLAGAIDVHAEEVYGKLSDAQKKAGLSLFLKLVEPLPDARFTRRRVAVESLLPAAGTPESGEPVDDFLAVVAKLAGKSARLITLRRNPGAGPTTVEIAHEATFRGWKRLADLLDQNSEFLLWKRRLDVEVADWSASGRKQNLLTGALLDRAISWVKERRADHSREECDYISASRRQRTFRRVYWSAGIVSTAVLLAIAIQLVVAALSQSQRIEDIQALCGCESAHGSNPSLALVLADDLAQRHPGRRAQELLQEAVQSLSMHPLLEPPPPAAALTGLFVQENGQAVAATAHNKVVVWTPAERKPSLWAPDNIANAWEFDFPGDPTNAAIDADGRFLAAGDQSGQLLVWLLAEGSKALATFKLDAAIAGLSFGRNGRLAAITNSDESKFNLVVWFMPAANKQESTALLPAKPLAIAVNPSSGEVATGLADGTLRFWNPATNTWGNTLRYKEPTPNFLAYSADGRSLASGTKVGEAYFWKLPMAGEARRFTPPGQFVIATAFSADGRRLVTLGDQDLLSIWDTATGVELFSFRGQPHDISKLALDHDGGRAFALQPQGVRIYELSPAELHNQAQDRLRDQTAGSLKDCAKYGVSPSVCDSYRKIAQP
jgi:hypothetical protein